jgi:ComF family protein
MTHGLASRLVADLLDFVFPGECPGCGVVTARANPFCTDCEAELAGLIAQHACPRCALPLPDEHAPCGRCSGKGLRPFASVTRLASFEGTLRHAIHAAKFRRRWKLADHLAARFVHTDRFRRLAGEIDLVVPVPMHPYKRWSRGYNQSEVIARRLARALHVPIARVVAKLKPTPSQSALASRAQRARNVADCFAISRPDLVEGQRVLIVDDILTSGATLRAVARAIMEGKPDALHAAVLASVSPRKTSHAPSRL